MWPKDLELYLLTIIMSPVSNDNNTFEKKTQHYYRAKSNIGEL